MTTVPDSLPSPFPPLAPVTILGALSAAVAALLAAQFFLHDLASTDFRAHSTFTDLDYTYLYRLRGALEAVSGLNGYGALFAIVLAAQGAAIALAYAVFRRAAAMPTLAALATVALFAFAPLPHPVDGSIYLGQIAPNVWHNTTFTLAWAPNLLLFLAVTRALGRPVTAGAVALVAALAALSLGAKPSFFIVLTPALAVWGLLHPGLIRRIAVLWALPLTMFAAYYVWLLPGDVETAIMPGAVWGLFSPSIPVSIAVSTMGFGVAALAYGRALTADPRIGLAALAVLAGIVQFYLLAEPGERFAHGNYAWAMHQAMAVLLVAVIAFLLRQPWDRRARIVCLAALPHLASGVFFALDLLLHGPRWFT
jgi:hypothetical protein